MMRWVLYGFIFLLIAGVLYWWSSVYDSCEGEVARGFWGQPICVESGL